MIKKPEIPQSFFYGEIESWKFRNTITLSHGAYCVRFTLLFSSGDSCNKQIGGFKTMRDALRAKEGILAELVTHTYIPFEYTIKECVDYWLYYYMADVQKISRNTFYSYRNILYNYLLKKLSGKLLNITIEQLVNAIMSIDKPSVRNGAIGVVSSFFKFARNNHLIEFDPSKAAIQIVKHQKSVPDVPEKQRVVYSLEQVKMLLYNCKKYFPKIYLPLLLSLTLGTRISETISLKYSDVDFAGQWVYVTKQLGKTIYDSELKELTPKTRSGSRKIPVPSFVLDELIIKRKWYEDQLTYNTDFIDSEYICCQDNGKPYHRTSFSNDYKKLIEKCGLHKITWHDLRHTYATILNNEINLKALSIFLGHARPEFSFDIYIYHEQPIYDGTKYMEMLWNIVNPISAFDKQKEQILEIRPDMKIIKNILPNTAK